MEMYSEEYLNLAMSIARDQVMTDLMKKVRDTLETKFKYEDAGIVIQREIHQFAEVLAWERTQAEKALGRSATYRNGV